MAASARTLYFINAQLQIVVPVRYCTGNPVRTLLEDNSAGYHHNFSSYVKNSTTLAAAQLVASETRAPGQILVVTNSLPTGTASGVTTATQAVASDNVLKQPYRQDPIGFRHWVVPITNAAGEPDEVVIMIKDFPSYSNEAPSFWTDPNPDT